jgi:hypothetical protein
MLLKGDVAICAPRKRVWDFPINPTQFSHCAPGAETIEVIDPLERSRGVRDHFNGEAIEFHEPHHAKLRVPVNKDAS